MFRGARQCQSIVAENKRGDKLFVRLAARCAKYNFAMKPFTPKDPDFAKRAAASFAKQRVMATLGTSLTAVGPGEIEITLPYREDLTQQHGFLHGGVVATIGDSACGYAAYSLMPADAGVLTIEYKINLLAPAKGDVFRAVGSVIRPAGRSR